MSDAADRGITVTEITAMDNAIDLNPTTVVAFVGRALRGPLDTPVLINNFGEFRRRFGELWSRSSLGPAVKQFFEHGGTSLYVVRVANHARGAMICLPASGSALVLRAVEPGSTECIRAAVDYDGLKRSDKHRFNLTLQRVDPGTGLVLDQEFYRRVDYRENSGNFVGDALLASSLVRVEQPLPTHRPEMTHGRGEHILSSYVGHAQAGADGHELTDYDLVGSRVRGTGLFALQQLDHIDIVYMPPPGKERDVGPAAVLAADLFCREHNAMLVVDPPFAWESVSDAIRGVREAGYASPNMLSYFPRLRERGPIETQHRTAGGGICGLLNKLDDGRGTWDTLDAPGTEFLRKLTPELELNDEDSEALVREGLNTIEHGPAGRARVRGSVTLGRGNGTHREFHNLSVRRLVLRIVSAIDAATRWAVFALPDARVAARVRSQVEAYLVALGGLGAFAGDHIDVHCDVTLCQHEGSSEPVLTLIIVFQPDGVSKPISLTLHQSVSGFRVASTAFAAALPHCA